MPGPFDLTPPSWRAGGWGGYNGWNPNASWGMPALQSPLAAPSGPTSIAGLYGPTPSGYMAQPSTAAPAFGAQPQAVPLGYGQMTSPMAQGGAPAGAPPAMPVAGGMPPEPQFLNPQAPAPITPGASGSWTPEPSMLGGAAASGGVPNAIPAYGAPVSAPLPAGVSGNQQIPITPKVPSAVDQNTAFAQNLGLANTIIGGVGAATQLGMGIYSLYKSADAYDFQKGLAQKNLTNQVSSYNTAMEDRIRGRHSFSYDQAHKGELDAELSRKSLSDKIS